MQEYFFNAAAHVAPTQETLKAYSEFSSSLAGHGHPSGLNAADRAASMAVEQAREKIADLLGLKDPYSIIFTGNCTQACEWGVRILRSIEYNVYPEDSMAVSPLEHSAVRSRTSNYQILPVNSNGVVSKPINSSIKKIICVKTQNEFGVFQEFSQLKYFYPDCYIFSDVSQAVGKDPIDLTQTEVAAMGAHKWGGLGGIGILYLKDSEHWLSYSDQPGHFLDQPGTLNVGGIVAAAVSLEQAINSLAERREKMIDFQLTLENGLQEMGLSIVGPKYQRTPGITLAAGFTRAAELLLELSQEGFMVGLGSACSSLETGASPTLQALGRTETKNNLMRISTFGQYDGKDAAKFIEILGKYET